MREDVRRFQQLSFTDRCTPSKVDVWLLKCAHVLLLLLLCGPQLKFPLPSRATGRQIWGPAANQSNWGGHKGRGAAPLDLLATFVFTTRVHM